MFFIKVLIVLFVILYFTSNVYAICGGFMLPPCNGCNLCTFLRNAGWVDGSDAQKKMVCVAKYLKCGAVTGSAWSNCAMMANYYSNSGGVAYYGLWHIPDTGSWCPVCYAGTRSSCYSETAYFESTEGAVCLRKSLGGNGFSSSPAPAAWPDNIEAAYNWCSANPAQYQNECNGC